ncbi:MAG: hypothetical protein Q6L60_08320 [Thermostichus sp. HHBFW_bins_43]
MGKRLELDYPAPVQQLITYGDAGDSIHNQPPGWPNYLKLGLTEAHIPDLIQVLQSRSWTREEELEEEPVTFWASIHAWRALGQLKAEAAVPVLLELLREADQGTGSLDEDWISEELPLVLGLIGPKAQPALQSFASEWLQQRRNTTASETYGLTAALDALAEIATGCRRFSQIRLGVPLPPASESAASEFMERLQSWLEPYAEQDPEINAWLITAFLTTQTNLPTKLALPADAAILKQIENVFAARRVDETICGDWDDLQLDLGLLRLEQLPAEKQAQIRGQKERTRQYHQEWIVLQRKYAPKTGFGSSIQPNQKKKKHRKHR